MSDLKIPTPPKAPPTNGGGGVTGVVNNVTDKLFAALPPGLLWLFVVNVIFLGAVMWFVSNETGQRAAIINRIIDGCSTALLHAQPQPGLK